MNNSELKAGPSIWERADKEYGYPSFTGECETEVLVVGGGLVGVSVCAELIKRGYRPVLVTDKRLISANTAKTTARITVQHDMIYDRLINKYGHNIAQKYYLANLKGLQRIKEDIDALNIDCDARATDAVLYTNSFFKRFALCREIEAYDALGIPHGETEKFELDTPYKLAVSVPDQLIINPVKYLNGIINSIAGKAEIYENSRVIDIEGGCALLRMGKIRASKIIIATNFPFVNTPGYYFLKLYRHRSYVMAHTANKPLRNMYESVDGKGLEVRSYFDGENNYIVSGGMEHRTGRGKKKFDYFGEIAARTRELTEVGDCAACWSAQDAMSMDLLPLAGRYAPDTAGLYLVSGMNKWGFTMSRTAAEVVCDAIAGREHPYREVYDTGRFNPVKGAGQFLPSAASDAASLAESFLAIPDTLSDKFAPGEGGVVNHEGRRVGVYKDETGKIYRVDGTCPHLKCALKWNKEERSWDCPCHGSRFDIYGKMLDGPSTKDIRSIE